jgi:RNA polymerase sigma factor (sigma-70 family)
VTRASGEDRQAWDALVERYVPLVWSIACRHRLSGGDAEAVGQAVWLYLVEYLGNLADPAALPGWLAIITRRECHRIQRARCQLPGAGQLAETMPDEQAVMAGPELLAAERDVALREAFARLPAAGQHLLGLLLADPPVPDAEISARLGIPVGSIGPSRRRYLDKLRRDPAIARLTSAEQQAGGKTHSRTPDGNEAEARHVGLPAQRQHLSAGEHVMTAARPGRAAPATGNPGHPASPSDRQARPLGTGNPPP